MGSSNTYRGGPGWEPRNTPGGRPKVSKGPVVKEEGTAMGGYDEHGRKGMPKSAHKKSRSRRSGKMNPTILGYS